MLINLKQHNPEKNESSEGGSGHDDIIFCSEGVGLSRDDAGGKNGDFWMTSFVNDPLHYSTDL